MTDGVYSLATTSAELAPSALLYFPVIAHVVGRILARIVSTQVIATDAVAWLVCVSLFAVA